MSAPPAHFQVLVPVTRQQAAAALVLLDVPFDPYYHASRRVPVPGCRRRGRRRCVYFYWGYGSRDTGGGFPTSTYTRTVLPRADVPALVCDVCREFVAAADALSRIDAETPGARRSWGGP